MDTFEYRIRQVLPADVEAAASVEAACFPPAEAADLSTLRGRAVRFPESFLVAETDHVVGLVNGCVTDQETISDTLFSDPAAHNPNGRYQAVFGLAVLPECRGRGVGAALMGAFCRRAREQGRAGVILTCKDRLIPFYEGLGFACMGRSASVHGGAVWYDMALRF